MMDREWQGILNRYGQQVIVYDGVKAQGVQTRAFLQPVLERQEQLQPTPLGLERQDRVIYLGPAAVPLTHRGWVEREGERYDVESAHLVGGGADHWWALLRPQKGAGL